MHIEIEVGLNFIISYLYNKLPRRRVNIFGEELEKALKHKFQGHWYPDKPVKGSAFRCFKTGDITDPVLEIAAQQSGVPVADILENLPHELSVWMDPGEVSYRIGEKGVIKILYSEAANANLMAVAPPPVQQQQQVEEFSVPNLVDHELSRTFNPDAQCFKPIDMIQAKFNHMNLSEKQPKFHSHSSSSDSGEERNSDNSDESSGDDRNLQQNLKVNGNNSNNMDGFLETTSAFMPRSQAPLTFTTATFAQTKFGSTKLKTNSKRSSRQFNSRISPVEFTNFLKQRSMQHQFLHTPNSSLMGSNLSPSRSLSPANHSMINNDPFFYHHHHQQPQHHNQGASTGNSNSSNNSSNDRGSSNGYYQQFLGSHHNNHHLYNGGGSQTNASSMSSASSNSSSASSSSANIGDHLFSSSSNNNNNGSNSNLNHRLTGQLFNHFYGPQETGFGLDNSSSFFGQSLSNGDGSVPGGETKPKFGAIGSGVIDSVQANMVDSFKGSLANDSNNNSGSNSTNQKGLVTPNNSANFPQLLVAN